MAQLARKYHEDLQKLDIVDQSKAERATDIENALKEIPEQQQMEDPQRSTMNRATTPDQVQMAIHLTKNNTATGMDGCPYKLWKTLHQLHQEKNRMKPAKLQYQQNPSNGLPRHTNAWN